MNNEHFSFRQKAENAPGNPGVYIMKDVKGQVIYVGKAKNIRTRLRSYSEGKDTRPLIPFLMSRVHNLEFIVTATEKEALILENTLIKKHRPRYNINFKDDKNYFSIRIDRGEAFPRLQLVRSVRKDGAKYFGPYSSSGAVRETIQYLHHIFPLRSCKDVEFNARKRPCIEYEIKRCLGPCCFLVTPEAYRTLVDEVIQFMGGHGKELVLALERRMVAAADRLDFEEASRLRDRLRAITKTLEKQRAVSLLFKDQDIFGFFREGNRIQMCLLYIRSGRILGQRKFPLVTTGAISSEVLSSVVKQYYDGNVFVPQEVIITDHVDDEEVIEEWLTEQGGGKKISILVPKRGERRKLLDMASENAKSIYSTERVFEPDETKALEILAERLRLRSVPRRIECFDISNIRGQYAVGSSVAFFEGKPDTTRYRRFRIRCVEGADDYAMMREVLTRRFRDKENLPDLIVVDGGKGQLNVALSVLNERGIDDIDVIGLAKELRLIPGSVSKRIYKEEDRIYLPKRKNPLYLSRFPQALFLLQRVRDEAHRFAVSYFRKVKEKNDLRVQIDEIPGIGRVRREVLLRHFGDVGNIRRASREELETVPGIGREMANLIATYFSTG